MKLALIVRMSGTCLGAPFQDLDFQSPKFNALPKPNAGSGVLVSDALPGWHLQTDGVDTRYVLYNNACLSCSSASVYGPDFPKPTDPFVLVPFSGLLFEDPSRKVSLGVYQLGDVPSNANSLMISGYVDKVANISISLNGSLLPLAQLQASDINTRHGLYGVDVSPFAGTTARLELTVNSDPVLPGNALIIEGMRFSSTTISNVPEPATWALWVPVESSSSRLGTGARFVEEIATQVSLFVSVTKE